MTICIIDILIHLKRIDYDLLSLKLSKSVVYKL